MEPVIVPIEDVIDLHTFHPRDIPSLIEDYVAECVRAGFATVRIIHGKGTGRLRQVIREALRNSAYVSSYEEGGEKEGGEGVTIAHLSED